MTDNRALELNASNDGVNASVCSVYETDRLCCRVGNTRVRVTEHFPRTGKTVVDLIGDMILADARIDG